MITPRRKSAHWLWLPKLLKESTWLRLSVNATKNISKDGYNTISETFIKPLTNYNGYPSYASIANPCQ